MLLLHLGDKDNNQRITSKGDTGKITAGSELSFWFVAIASELPVVLFFSGVFFCSSCF